MRSIDIKVGMKLVIREGPQKPVMANPWHGEQETKYKRDTTMEGVVFQVKGISLPFIAIKPYACPGFMDENDVQTGHLDLREYKVALAQPSYVKALRENVTKALPQRPQLLSAPLDDRPMRQRLIEGVWVWEACEE